jgi:hypothetical protein
MSNACISLKFLLEYLDMVDQICQFVIFEVGNNFCWIGCIRALDSETYAKELFEECVVHLKERLKEKERLREEEKVMTTILGFYTL